RRFSDLSSTFGSATRNTATWRCATGCDPSGGLAVPATSLPRSRGRRVVELDAVRVALLREEELAALAVVLLGSVARDDRVEVRRVPVRVGALLRAQDPTETLRLLLAAPPRAGDLDRDVRVRDVDGEVPDLRDGEHGCLARPEALVQRVAFRLRRLARDQRNVPAIGHLFELIQVHADDEDAVAPMAIEERLDHVALARVGAGD